MSESWVSSRLERIPPQRVLRLLADASWVQTGGRSGLYARFVARNADVDRLGHSIVVPLDQEAPDYSMLLAEAVEALQTIRGDEDQPAVLARLLTSSTDEFSFATETAAPKGWIRWDEGMRLLESARAFLSSGAKTAREPRRYFGNRHGQFASRFLGEVMMGQTAVGSYVVRAYVPSEAAIPFHGGAQADEAAHFVGVDAVSGREVSRVLVATLEAAADAIEHYQRNNSLAGFTDAVTPISYEAVRALQAIAVGGDESVVRVSWESDEADVPELSWDFRFTPDVAPVLARAATELVLPEPQPETSARGTVHLLTRAEESGPGVIGITTLDGRPANKLRVRLQATDYHRAVLAHDEGHIVHVIGNLEKESNLAWLYDARVTAITQSAPSPDVSASAHDGDDGLFELPPTDDSV